MTDFYGGPTPYAVSVLDGIKAKVGTASTVTQPRRATRRRAVSAAKAARVADRRRRQRSDVRHRRTRWRCSTRTARPSRAPTRAWAAKGRDRESLDLSRTKRSIKQVFAANPRTIVVLVSSFPYAITWSQANVPAILHITHAAQEQGTAIADVIFGDYNPGGHLTTTWPASLEQLPRVRVVRHPQGPHLPVLQGRAALRVRPRAELLDVRVREAAHERADAWRRTGP